MIKNAIFAAGCFWCTEAIFKRLKGVHSVISGYTGGVIKNPAYREVCQGRTGHAEGIKIEYDPQFITYQELLEIFFSTHDPTTLNRQGNDVGTQYRSAIFYVDDEQYDTATQYIKFLEDSKQFDNPIVTQLELFDIFYEAEPEHFDYYDLNKEQPYCSYIILPKLEKLNAFHSDKLKS